MRKPQGCECECAARHTPGPWTVTDLDAPHDFDRSIMARTPIHGNPVAVARVYGGGILAKANSASVSNALLIAAAPDLLAACKSALVDLERLFPDRLENLPDTAQYAVARRLQAVILKAEGGGK
jgi:hypothetical protein